MPMTIITRSKAEADAVHFMSTREKYLYAHVTQLRGEVAELRKELKEFYSSTSKPRTTNSTIRRAPGSQE